MELICAMVKNHYMVVYGLWSAIPYRHPNNWNSYINPYYWWPSPFMGKHPIFSAWHSEWEASLSGVNAQRNFLECQYMCRSYPCKTWRKQANCPTSALNSKPFAVPVSKTAKLLDFCLDGTWWTFRDTSCKPPNMSPINFCVPPVTGSS
jgi:hypothetical protein